MPFLLSVFLFLILAAGQSAHSAVINFSTASDSGNTQVFWVGPA